MLRAYINRTTIAAGVFAALVGILTNAATGGFLLGLGVALAVGVSLSIALVYLGVDDVQVRSTSGTGTSRGEMSTKQLIATGGATVSSVGIVGLIKQDVIGGITYALTYGFVGFLNDLFEDFAAPLTALVGGVADIIESSLTGMLIDSGFRTAARALESYGIIAPLVAAAVTLGVGAMLYVVFRRVDFSPIQLIYDKMP